MLSRSSIPVSLENGDTSRQKNRAAHTCASQLVVLIAALVFSCSIAHAATDQIAPTNGTLTASPGNSQVVLKWSGFADSGSGLASYKLVFNVGMWPATSCTTGTVLFSGTGTTFTHSSLTNGTTYYYLVCAIDNAGNTSTGAIASATPHAGDTTAPLGGLAFNPNVSSTASTTVTLALSASDAVGVTGYFVSTSSTTPTTATPGWTPVTSTTVYSGSLPFILPSGDGSKTVYAWYRDAAGNISTAASDAIVLDQTAPTNGTLTASPGNAQIVLNWSGFADAGSGVSSYKLVFNVGMWPAISCTTGTVLFSGTGTTFTHSSLTNGTTYYYLVCATDNAGHTSTGAIASATPKAGADTTAPLGSLAFSPNASSTKSTAVTLALSASDAVGVTGYFVSTSSTPPTTATPGWVSVTSTTAYTASAPFTLPSTDGSKTVYAWYRDAAGNISTAASAIILLDQTAPTNGSLTATPGSTQIVLSWSGFTDTGSGLASAPYKLFSSTSTFPASCTGTPLFSGSQTTFTHTGLTNGTTYYYRVCATDNAGNTSSGATASATPKTGGDTTAPSGSLAFSPNLSSTNSTTVTLALSASDAVGVTGYFVSTSSTPPTTATPGWVSVNSTTVYSGSVPFTLPSSNGSKTVYAWYRDAAGNISTTASRTILLDQTAPTNGTLSATAGNGQVALSWSGFTDTGSGLATTNTYKLVFSAGTSSPTSCSTGTQLFLGATTSFTQAGLSNGATYSYRLCAWDQAGNTSTGATASATPQQPSSNSTLVGFIPGVGDAHAVAVANGRAYVASDPFGLSVANVTNSTNPVIIGSSDIPFYGHSVAVSGNRAVVGGKAADGTAHLWVLDISTPASPTVLGELATTVPVTTSGTGYMGVALNSTGTMAVMAMGTTGIYVVDLSTPTTPFVRGTYNTPGVAFAVVLNPTGTLAYVADGSTGHLQIVNLTNPSLPTLAASVSMPGTQVDLALSGSLVYLVSTTGTIDVVDVTNPSAPLHIGGSTTALSGSGIRVVVEGSVAAVLSTNTSDFLDVLSLANPAVPVRMGSVTLGPPGTGKGVSLVGGLAYVAADAVGGLEVYDVSTPTPIGTGAINDDFLPKSIAVSSGLAGVAVVSGKHIPTGNTRLQVLTVANPATPTVVGQLPTTIHVTTTGTGYMGVALNSTATMAVMALGTTGISAVNLAVPTAPAFLGTYNTPGVAYGVVLDSTGTLAYVADGIGHLQIVNLTNPKLPTLKSSVAMPGTQVDLALAGSRVYLVSSTGSFDIVDVSNPAAPLRIGGAATALSGAGVHVAVEGSVAAVLSTGASDFLDILDVSNPSLPVRVASVTLGPVGTGKGVSLVGGRAYVAANTGGLWIYDLTTPRSPVLLPVLATVGDALEARVQNGVAYVADFPATVDIIDLIP
jgi:hypothetical protein